MSSFVPWLTSKLGLRRLKGRDLQESLDVARALMLIAKRQETNEQLPDESKSSPSLEKNKAALQDALLAQLVHPNVTADFQIQDYSSEIKDGPERGVFLMQTATYLKTQDQI